MTIDDQIRLALPADAEYGRIARIAAAGLAVRLGFSYREIEDVRLAVDEAVILLLRAGNPDGVLTVLFDPVEGELGIDAHLGPGDGELGDGELGEGAGTAGRGPSLENASMERFATIVSDVVDDYEVDAAGRRVRLRKRHREPT